VLEGSAAPGQYRESREQNSLQTIWELKADDVSDGMIRLSCGIEEVEDLVADLKQALM
jgi:cystathionine beta-lyase/cystathionine gamma-synthase